MKKLLLTPLAFAAFTLALQAQTDTEVPSVESVTEPVSDRAQNPDMDELPPVDEGTPDMDMPGMRTVDGDLDGDGTYSDDTAPLDEGFAKDVDGTDADIYEVEDERDAEMAAPGEADGYTPVVDEAERGVESAADAVEGTYDDMTDGESTDADAEDGRWIDRDSDGYTPVVDEVEQGAETAVKATGEALSTAKDAVEGVVTDEGETDVNMDVDAPANSDMDERSTTEKVKDGVQGAAETVKDGAATFGSEVEETYDEAKDEATEMNTRGATEPNATAPNADADAMDAESDYIDRDADGYTPVVDEVEQGTETAVKATGEAIDQATDETEELNEAEELIEGGPDGDADDMEGYDDPN